MPYGKILLDETSSDNRPRIVFDTGFSAGTLTEVTGFYVFFKNGEKAYVSGVKYENFQWHLIIGNNLIPIITGMRVKK